MPSRPEQHRTEDASRRAFEAVLPEEWVYRQLSHDYGIDGEVEVFAAGETTGLLFKVQLKGTQRDIRTVRLSHDKARYYESLPVPVLIVLFHGPSGSVFARWFQSFDRHDEPPTEQSIGLTFGDEHKLTPSTVRELARDLEVHRQISHPEGVVPMELVIVKDAEMVGGVASATLSIELRQFAETAPDILRIASETDKEAFGAVILRTSSITVSIRGLLTSTVHYQYPWPPDSSPAPAFNDALMMLAMIINRLGRYDVSARLFSEYGANSSVIHSEELIATVAGVLIRTHRLGDAIRILESLDGRDAFDQMLVALSISWIGRPQALTDQERTEVTDYLLRKADRDEEHADPRQAAISRYNLANRLRTLGDHKRAIAQYERAAELDPSYEERPYFSGDLAGSLFESGRYLDAVQRYQIAVDGGARERYLPLLADALLMAGRYKLAAEAFEHVLNETIASRNPSEWSLKALIAGTITDSIADEQARDTERAHQLALLPDDTPDDEALQRSTQALEADALCPEAWFNLAIVRMRRDEAEAAFIAFSASAVLSRTHFFAFAMAIILGLDLQERLVGDLVRTAYFFGGSDFIRFLGEELEGPSPEDRAALLNAVDSILETAGPREGGRSVELRFLEDDGTVHSMHVGLE